MLDTLPDWKTLLPEEKLARVKPLAAVGSSASEIATHFINATRNSIIGFCGKRKIKLLGTAPKPPAKVKPAPVAKKANGKGQPKANAIIHKLRHPAPKVLPFDVEDNFDATDVTHLLGIMDLGSVSCRWIHGDPLAQHGYCGRHVRESSSYCPEHHKRVYLRVQR